MYFQQKLLGDLKLSTRQVVCEQYEIDCWTKTSKPRFSQLGEKKVNTIAKNCFLTSCEKKSLNNNEMIGLQVSEGFRFLLTYANFSTDNILNMYLFVHPPVVSAIVSNIFNQF